MSLGPSSTERDSLYPQEAMILANYCDDSGQPIPTPSYFRPDGTSLLNRRSGGTVRCEAGRVDVIARPLNAGAFRSAVEIRWLIENPGPGTLYALTQRQTYSVLPGSTVELQTESNQQGDAPFCMDASGSEGDTIAVCPPART